MAIAKYMPERQVFEYPDIPDPAAIDYAMIWKHPAGDLENYPNLKAIFSLGSGVDYIDAYPALPQAPIFRLIDTNMADDMALYTLYWAVHFQRKFGLYSQQQTQKHWQRYPTPLAPDYKIAMLGLGAIGGHIARRLAANGFDVTGWSRSAKSLEGIRCVHGEDQLLQILPEMDVVVCCLPFTDKTFEYLDYALLSHCKQGACFINISRGAVIHEGDLLRLLDKGHIGAAALDVFHQEPLPQNSPFWDHPRVHVTPHMSGATNPDTAVQIIAKELADFENGIMPPYPYRRSE